MEPPPHLPKDGITCPPRGHRAQHPINMGGLLRGCDPLMDTDPQRRRCPRRRGTGLPTPRVGQIPILATRNGLPLPQGPDSIMSIHSCPQHGHPTYGRPPPGGGPGNLVWQPNFHFHRTVLIDRTVLFPYFRPISYRRKLGLSIAYRYIGYSGFFTNYSLFAYNRYAHPETINLSVCSSRSYRYIGMLVPKLSIYRYARPETIDISVWSSINYRYIGIATPRISIYRY